MIDNLVCANISAWADIIFKSNYLSRKMQIYVFELYQRTDTKAESIALWGKLFRVMDNTMLVGDLKPIDYIKQELIKIITDEHD